MLPYVLLKEKKLNSNECSKCGISYKDPLFWETHQTMSDGKIWCTNKTSNRIFENQVDFE
jgi:formylmethanofuran dehydrogenase subunit E